MDHLKIMASYGYGCTRQEVADIDSDYAVHLQKRTKDSPFIIRWFRGFIERWSELRVLKSQGLVITRAKCVSVANIDKYFKELANVLTNAATTGKSQTIALLGCGSASGYAMPPYLYFLGSGLVSN